jgi:hypothetical protein
MVKNKCFTGGYTILMVALRATLYYEDETID